MSDRFTFKKFFLMTWSVFCLLHGPAWAGDCTEGWDFFRQGNHESDFIQKELLYQKALALCPDLAEAWNNLADAEDRLGKFDEAEAHYRKAISINPKLDISHFSLGDLNLKQKKYPKAVAAYVEGLKINPGDELALKGLREAEAGMQISGGILSAEYIKTRLSTMNLMGPGGTRPRMAFQNIFFEFDSDRIKKESEPQLDQIGKALTDLLAFSPDRILLEGHTDNLGDQAYNQRLSERRAESVRQYLVGRFHLDEPRILVNGFGATKPVASNDSKEGRAKNRRVEFQIVR